MGSQHSVAPLPVTCAKGHAMHAKVAHELLDKVRPRKRTCHACRAAISPKDASYRCTSCAVDLCMRCSKSQMYPAEKPQGARSALKAIADAFFANDQGKKLVDVLPGDIFFFGPDRLGTHHVVVVRSPLRTDSNPLMYEKLPAGYVLMSCETVEATQGNRSENMNWYLSRVYMALGPAGSLEVVGEWAHGQKTVCTFEEHLPVKVLLHPLRAGFGGPELDPQVFETVVTQAAEESRPYGWRTAVKAFAGRKALNPQSVQSKEQRAKLLQELQKRWKAQPICSSVAIIVWQKYFLEKSREADPSFGEDLAVQQILRYMPVYCDNTTPSSLLKTLTSCGWVLHETLYS
uniref:Uncharacterized protein n=1 Tax=Noctiluca scintillans TaxID=2966 RepID=A0A7S1AFN9_NOCSC|mmetsp:Transcript_44411/g.117848  ORF Transcript_44411/g.117848 Transcript_44411/m.117848 type:complete len:346 (+) Transcript_44411:67-1104(+)